MAEKGKRVIIQRRSLWRWWVLLPLCCVLLGALAVGALARPALPISQPTPAPAPVAQTSSTPVPVFVSIEKPAPTPPPKPAYNFSSPAPERPAVGEEYFADAVFLGDSRTDGLRLYSGIRGAEFMCRNGMTVFDGAKKKIVKGEDGQKYTMLEALALRQYAKIYLMFGINELGYYNDQGFYDAYATLIDDIRALQPAATLYIEAIIPINPEKVQKDSEKYYITNEKIAVYNALLQTLAVEKQVVYLDLATALTDENGALPLDQSTDGIHFKRLWYEKWYDYLGTHTVDMADYAEEPTSAS